MNKSDAQNPTTDTVVSDHDLGACLLSIGAKQVIAVEPGGNAGDHLIYHGLKQKAEGLGLDVESIGFDDYLKRQVPPNSVVYIHGGGGYVPWWSGKAMTLAQHAIQNHRGHVVIGPTTVHSDEGYVREVGQTLTRKIAARDVFMFARERTSYEIMKRVMPSSIHLGLDHDTALSLTRARLLAEAGINDVGLGRSYELYAVREDAESPGLIADKLRVPIDPVLVSKSFTQWVSLHANATRIITNRLHSSIAGAVLGIDTTVLPNSYHKNRGVWEMSLQPRGVKWSQTLTLSLRTRMLATNYFGRRILNSRRVQEILRLRKYGLK